jgi:hypothetical protein
MSTTSSSPRKRRTTASSRVGLVLAAAALAAACGRGPRETFVTYFSGDHGLSLRLPATWLGDQGEQDGVWYRVFAPPAGPPGAAPVSVTLLAAATEATVDAYAGAYLEGHTVESTRPEERQGERGRSWVSTTADGGARQRLLLLAVGDRLVGLHARGGPEAMERLAPVLEEVWSSLTLERPEAYPVTAFSAQRASLGLPSSWRETRRFSSRGTLVTTFVSPPLAVDEGGQPVHASLTVTFEPVPDQGGLREYYDASRRRLGDNFQLASHASFREGLVDVMRTETPVTVTFVKRFYFAREGRGCSLTFEAREDVFARASRWADYIASTLRLGTTEAAPR